MRVAAGLVLVFITAVFCVHAQTLDLGIQPYHVYQGGQIDQINLDNGSLNIAIPLVSYPQRGSQLSLSFELVFSGAGTHALTQCQIASLPGSSQRVRECTTNWSTGRNLTSGGQPMSLLPSAFSGTVALVDTQDLSELQTSLNFVSSATVAGDCAYTVCSSPYTVFLGGHTTQVTWNSADGSEHPAGQMSDGQIALDGSGYQNGMTYAESQTSNFGTPTCKWMCSEPGFIAVKDGVSYFSSGSGPSTPNGPILREDADGNYITRNGAQYVDSTGRAIPLPTLLSSPTSQQIASCGGPLPIAKIATWTPPGFSSPFLFCYANVTISLPYEQVFTPGTSSFDVGTATEPELQNVVLPNQQVWTFQYGQSFNITNAGQVVASGLNFGDLTQITFPTGGTLGYQWGAIGLQEYPPLGTVGTTLLQSRTLNANDGTGPHTWTYNIQTCGPNGGTCTSTVTDPLGDVTSQTITFGGAPPSTATRKTSIKNSAGHVFKTVTRSYPGQYASWNGFPLYPTSEQTTLDNGQSTLTTRNYCCDINFLYSLLDSPNYTQGQFPWAATIGRVTDEKVYDYSTSQGALLRDTQTSYEFQNNASYYNSGGESPGFFDLPSQQTIYNGAASAVAKTNYNYDSGSRSPSGITTQFGIPLFPVGGHLTSKTDWLNAGGTSPVSSFTYYDTGELHQATDPRGKTTTYLYSSTYGGALPTTATNALGQQSQSSYVAASGKIASVMDANNQSTTYTYSDPLARLTKVTEPDGGSTIYHYNDTGTLGVTVTQAIRSGVNKILQANVDGMGRLYETQLTSDTQGTVNTRTSYDALGRTSQVWNPTRCNPMTATTCASESSWGIATTGYDALNRITSQLDTDQVSTQLWGYNGNQVTFTDESKNQWVRTSDALARITQVLEPNGSAQAASMETDYTYDALSNLLTVIQYGGPTSSPDPDGPVKRSYTYDSLSRLVCASNAENSNASCPAAPAASYAAGVTSYGYDPAGNLTSKTSPAPNSAWNSGTTATTTYQYDALNRLTYELATASTAPSTLAHYFYYDQVSLFGTTLNNPIGRLTLSSASLTSGSSTYLESANFFWNHDAMGRVLGTKVCTPSTCNSSNIANSSWFTLSNSYDLAGDGTSYSDGVNTTIGESYDSAGRLSTVTSTQNGGTPATLWTANTNGPIGLTQATLGNGVVEALAYNNRTLLQSQSAKSAGGVTIYSEGLTYYPDGDVNVVTDPVNGNWTYSYDTLRRISTGVSTNTSQGCQFAYDHFGNRTLEGPYQSGSCLSKSATFTGSSANHVAGYCYDAAGDLLNAGPCAPQGSRNPYFYDGYGTLLVGNYNFSDYTSYTVDEYERRTAKWQNSAMQHQYLYGADGNPVTELDGSGNWLQTNVRAGGMFLAELQPSGISYLHADHLGTIRAQSNSAGTRTMTCSNLPFGDSLNCNGNTAPPGYHYTGKERDAESGNDYFGARYYASSMGRFMSPDWAEDPSNVPYATFSDPQSLNLYSYGLNNPLKNRDSDGHSCDPDYTTTNANGDMVVHAGACHLDWWDLPGHAWVGLANLMTASTPKQAATGAGQMFYAYSAALPFAQIGVGLGAADGLISLGLEADGAGAAGEGAAVETGAQSTDVTTGKSIKNWKTNATPDQVGKTLESNGFEKKTLSDGSVQYSKGNTDCTMYPKAKSTGGPSMQVKVNNVPVSKVRMK